MDEMVEQIAELEKERDSFYMDYRMKCDEELKLRDTQIQRLVAENYELEKDAVRYRFVLPIITGHDSDEADVLAMSIAVQLAHGLDGNSAIDAVMELMK
jgi:hypothetical protein